MDKLPLKTFQHIHRIQMRTRHLVSTELIGAYRSAFKGRGVEFLEVREFESGDDLKNVDWNVTARMNQPYVKKFQEERALTVMLVVDVSASAQFGSSSQAKRELIAEVAALLAFSAIDNHDRIGLLLFSGKVEKYLPPARGQRHALRVIRELLTAQGHYPGTELGEALSYLSRLQRKPAICFILSDFITDTYEYQLKIAAKRYDCVAIRVLDPLELALPQLGLVHFEDLETGQDLLVDTSDLVREENFERNTVQLLDKQKHFLERLGIGLIDIRTNQPYTRAIRDFFHAHHQSKKPPPLKSEYGA